LNTGLTSNVDILSQNYHEMSEIGKEKLKQVSERILSIYNLVNEKKPKPTNEEKILNKSLVWDFK
jgi:hypothetical protein